jgi:hypothetical protein
MLTIDRGGPVGKRQRGARTEHKRREARMRNVGEHTVSLPMTAAVHRCSDGTVIADTTASRPKREDLIGGDRLGASRPTSTAAPSSRSQRSRIRSATPSLFIGSVASRKRA